MFSDKLLCYPHLFGGLSYSRSLGKAWEQLRSFLIFSLGDSAIAGWWTIEDAVRFMKGFQSLPDEILSSITRTRGNIGIRRVSDVRRSDGLIYPQDQ